MYTQVSSRSPCPPIEPGLTNGSSLSLRRVSVVCGSKRAHRRAASKSNSATSKTELQLRVGLATRLLEHVREVILKRDRRQSKLDQVRIRLDACLAFGLPDQCRAHPAANTTAFFVQETGFFRCPHNRFEPCLAHDKLAGRRLAMNGLYLLRSTFGRACRLLAPARWGFACRCLCHDAYLCWTEFNFV